MELKPQDRVQERLDDIESRLSLLERGQNANMSTVDPSHDHDHTPDFRTQSNFLHNLRKWSKNTATNVIQVIGERSNGKTTFVRDLLLPHLGAKKVCVSSMNANSTYTNGMYMYSVDKTDHHTYTVSFEDRQWAKTVCKWLYELDKGNSTLKERVHFVIDEVQTKNREWFVLDRLIKDTVKANLSVTWILVSQETRLIDESNVFPNKDHGVPTFWMGPTATGSVPSGCVNVQIQGYSRTYRYPIPYEIR
jgi:predicted AAA+ superfamily ATPase